MFELLQLVGLLGVLERTYVCVCLCVCVCGCVCVYNVKLSIAILVQVITSRREPMGQGASGKAKRRPAVRPHIRWNHSTK